MRRIIWKIRHHLAFLFLNLAEFCIKDDKIKLSFHRIGTMKLSKMGLKLLPIELNYKENKDFYRRYEKIYFRICEYLFHNPSRKSERMK